MNIVDKYFPELTPDQKSQFAKLQELYTYWNSQINVISRKDTENLYEKHVLHSLGIAKVMSFSGGSSVLDVGTGGGFPGIPLAIMFPEVSFHLVDSIAKKIKVVEEVSTALGLKNIKAETKRAEKVSGQFDFVVSRAVTAMPKFMTWMKGKFLKENKNSLPNGILYLKGGELSEELKSVRKEKTIYDLSNFFSEDFFETKKVVHVKM